MNKTTQDGAELLVVALAQTGDKDAFTELVRRRQEWIRNLLRRLCHHAELADDLAQQTFLQAWREITKLREPQKFPGWLKRIAVNVWLQHQRKNDPLSRAEDVDDLASQTDSAQGFGIRTKVDQPGLGMDLDTALAALSQTPRLCIVLAYHEGMNHGEIAEVLGLPEGTVKSHIRRGSARLRELLQAYGVEKDSE